MHLIIFHTYISVKSKYADIKARSQSTYIQCLTYAGDIVLVAGAQGRLQKLTKQRNKSLGNRGWF